MVFLAYSRLRRHHKDAAVFLEITDKRNPKAPAHVIPTMGNCLMNAAKKKRLEAAGWKVASTGEFLDLTREESELVEVKLAPGKVLKRRRARSRS